MKLNRKWFQSFRFGFKFRSDWLTWYPRSLELGIQQNLSSMLLNSMYGNVKPIRLLVLQYTSVDLGLDVEDSDVWNPHQDSKTGGGGGGRKLMISSVQIYNTLYSEKSLKSTQNMLSHFHNLELFNMQHEFFGEQTKSVTFKAQNWLL